LGGIASKYRV